jgi:hypothetical protein
MRLALCLVLTVVAGSSRASPRAPMPEPARQYFRARAECGRPGPRIAAFMQRYFDQWLSPSTFGARVIRGWAQFTADQRAAFDRAAEINVLAPERTRVIHDFCNKRDRYDFVLESTGSDAVDTGHEIQYRKVMVQRQIGVYHDWYQLGWVLVEHAGHWSLDSVTVPGADYPGIDRDPVPAALRTALAGASFDQAMALVETPGVLVKPPGPP